MTKRFVGVLIFAFVVASVASLLLYRLLASSRPASAKTAASTIRLAVAARNLEAGVVLKEEDVRMAEWTGSAPEGAFPRPQDLVGRGVTTRIVSREPILESRLASKGAGGGLASMIPEGMRAVAIRVNDVAGVAGFVTPGMRVDVLISGTPGATNTSAALGSAVEDDAAKRGGALRRSGFQEGRGRQADHGAGSEPAGNAGAGGDVKPGIDADHNPTRLAQSAGSHGGEDSRHGGRSALQGRQPPGRCAAARSG